MPAFDFQAPLRGVKHLSLAASTGVCNDGPLMCFAACLISPAPPIVVCGCNHRRAITPKPEPGPADCGDEVGQALSCVTPHPDPKDLCTTRFQALIFAWQPLLLLPLPQAHRNITLLHILGASCALVAVDNTTYIICLRCGG